MLLGAVPKTEQPVQEKIGLELIGIVTESTVESTSIVLCFEMNSSVSNSYILTLDQRAKINEAGIHVLPSPTMT
jgi:tetrahydromethanopterin S-methyltransferase subunit H